MLIALSSLVHWCCLFECINTLLLAVTTATDPESKAMWVTDWLIVWMIGLGWCLSIVIMFVRSGCLGTLNLARWHSKSWRIWSPNGSKMLYQTKILLLVRYWCMFIGMFKRHVWFTSSLCGVIQRSFAATLLSMVEKSILWFVRPNVASLCPQNHENGVSSTR